MKNYRSALSSKLRNLVLSGRLFHTIKLYNVQGSSHFKKNGFTLIELIIVLIIIAVASSLVGIFILRGSGNLELKSFTKYVSASLRYARNLSVAEKKVYSLIIWKDKGAYGLYADLTHIDDIEEASPVFQKNIPELLQIIFDNGADHLRIDFFPRGDSSGGAIEITNQKGAAFLIMVNRITGRIVVTKINK